MITPYTADEWQDVQRTNELARTLRLIDAHLDDVLTGARRAVFIFGGSGLGKNYLVERALSRHGRDAVRSTPKSFFEALGAFHRATYRRGRNPKAVVFDEAELIFKNEKNLNVMKDATDASADAPLFRDDFTYLEEDVNEEGETKMVKRHGTSLNAPIIVMTNRNLDDLGKDREHAEALFASRVLPINLTSDPLVVWEYVCSLALRTHLLTNVNGNGVPLETRARVLDWFTDNLWNLKQVSVRTLQNALREFAHPRPEFLNENLGLLLKPKAERVSKTTPQRCEWAKLRVALTGAK